MVPWQKKRSLTRKKQTECCLFSIACEVSLTGWSNQSRMHRSFDTPCAVDEIYSCLAQSHMGLSENGGRILPEMLENDGKPSTSGVFPNFQIRQTHVFFAW